MFGKLLTNQKIAHKIVKPYVYKALREGLKTHDNGKIQNLRGFGSLPLRNLTSQHAESQHFTSAISYLGYDLGTQACLMEDFVKLSSLFYQLQGTSSRKSTQVARNHCFDSVCDFAN